MGKHDSKIDKHLLKNTLKVLLTDQRAVTGAGRHSENEPCRAMTTTDRHAAHSHSLDDSSTTFGENVIGLLCAY
jgi:hypothetical protein